MTKLPNPSSKEARISMLVFDRFPNLNFINKDNPDYDWEKHKTFDFKEEERKAEEYRNKLFSYSDEELIKLYEPVKIKSEEKRKMEAAAGENRLFNKPCTKADYEYWNKADYWTIAECLALTFEKDPKAIDYSYVVNNHYFKTSLGYEASKFAKKYDELFNLIHRSVESGTLEIMPTYGKILSLDKKRVIPAKYIGWAKSKNISLPEELSEKFTEVTDYKSLLDAVVKTMNSIQEQKLKLEEENKSLKEDLKQKERQRIIKTLYKILCGLVLKHYGKSETNRVSMIKKTLFTEAGIDMDEKTIRAHVEKSLEEDQSKKE